MPHFISEGDDCTRSGDLLLDGSVLDRSRATPITTFSYTSYGDDNYALGKRLLGFNAQFRDSLSGLYLLGNGYRAYNCELQRFHSPDALSPFRKGGVNAYGYCAGDPVNYLDPSGAIRWWFRKTIRFEGDYQILYPGSEKSPSSFHKEVFKSGHAGFVTHGNAEKGPVLMNQKGEMVPAKDVTRKEIAPRLRGLGSYGKDSKKPIYLFACSAGASGAAQQVADELGRPVISYKYLTLHLKAQFMNLQPETDPVLGMMELPPVPYAPRIAEPLTFIPGAVKAVRK